MISFKTLDREQLRKLNSALRFEDYERTLGTGRFEKGSGSKSW